MHRQTSRVTKIVGFSVPPALAREVEQVAKKERRTKSELFREMFRVYLSYRKQREVYDDRWVMDLIQGAREEQEKNPMTQEQVIKESKELARYGARQTKKVGLQSKDVNKIIYKARKRGDSWLYY